MSKSSIPTLDQTRALLDDLPEAPHHLEALSRQAGFSRFHFIRAFRQAYGLTPYQYLMGRRIDKAKSLLANSDHSVTDICFIVGFQSPGSFSNLFRRLVGKSPMRYRQMVRERRAAARLIPCCYQTMYGLRAAE
jgi:AraC-like DNA-binding protein